MKIVAVDYKGGKWFVLNDEDRVDDMDFVREEINVEHVLGKGLREHVCACIWYGIEPYHGADKDLHAKISKIYADLEKSE